MTSPNVLILHGYQHTRPEGHWLWWLHDQLVARGIDVRYPQLPTPEDPNLDAWVSGAQAELASLGGEGERLIVTHSLGGILWHHLVARGVRADRALLVAPPSHDRLADHIPAFSLDAIDEAVAGTVAPMTVLAREVDPYRNAPLDAVAAAWGADAVTLPGEGHINLDDGHGPFPPALAWVLTGVATP